MIRFASAWVLLLLAVSQVMAPFSTSEFGVVLSRVRSARVVCGGVSLRCPSAVAWRHDAGDAGESVLPIVASAGLAGKPPDGVVPSRTAEARIVTAGRPPDRVSQSRTPSRQAAVLRL